MKEPLTGSTPRGPQASSRLPQIPRNHLAQGDCIEEMRHLPNDCIDLVITDPPYIVDYRDRNGRRIANDNHSGWLKPAFREISRTLKPDSYCIVFYGWNRVERFIEAWKEAGLQRVGHIVWNKSYASKTSYLAAHHECAYLLTNGHPQVPSLSIPDVLPWKYTGNRYHPTQKPVMAIEPLVRAFSQPGDLILDPFAGSATTAVASRLQGRDYLGIELDPKYHRIAADRLRRLEYFLRRREEEKRQGGG